MPQLRHLPPPSHALRLERALFNLAWLLLCRWTPRPFHGIRRAVLRAFGARIHRTAHVYPDCKVWRPRNLTMDARSCLGPGVECYCVDAVILEEDALVSQGAYLCTASHDVNSPGFELSAAPICIEAAAWVAARAVVLPGVTVSRRSVIAAAAVATRSTEPEGIYGGNPAKLVSHRSSGAIQPGTNA